MEFSQHSSYHEFILFASNPIPVISKKYQYISIQGLRKGPE